MDNWTSYYGDTFTFSADKLRQVWDTLHAGNKQPLPTDDRLLQAWRAYHEGRYLDAYTLGQEQGGEGLIVAAFAATMSAHFLHFEADKKLALLELAMKTADQGVLSCPHNANSYYILALAQGRYSQFISVVEALQKGFGGKMKSNLKKALELEPEHAEAHLAYAAWNAEIVDKVGGLLGGLTYAASKDNAKKHFDKAVKLAPKVPIVYLEKANGLILMTGRSAKKEAHKLIETALALTPMDAMQWLDREKAREMLQVLGR